MDARNWEIGVFLKSAFGNRLSAVEGWVKGKMVKWLNG